MAEDGRITLLGGPLDPLSMDETVAAVERMIARRERGQHGCLNAAKIVKLQDDTALRDAEQHLKDRGIVQKGDVYAITCGEPMGAPGGTNMLKICQVE